MAEKEYVGPIDPPRGGSSTAPPQNERNKLRLAIAEIEQMAEERHMLHGARPEGFWGCSRAGCKRAVAFLRELRG